MTEYAQIDDPGVQVRIRSRYATEIVSLQRLSFQTLGFLLEREGKFSAIWQLPILLLMLPKREVLTFSRPLRLGVSTVLLQHIRPSTIALCMGKGVKLYTRFSDDSLLISSTFHSYAVPRPGSKIIKPPASSTIEIAWPAHREQVSRLEAQSRQVQPTTTFEEFLDVAHLEEDLSQYK